MGGRVTRAPQSKDLVRAKSLRQALTSGVPPAFVPPTAPNPVGQPSALSWASQPKDSRKSNPHESLDSHRQYLEQLFEGSPDSLIIVDGSFHTLCVNLEFQRMFGYSAAQIMGQSVHDLILPSERAAESEWIVQCLRRGERITLETQRRCSDGTLLEVSLSSSPLVIDGRTAAFYAIYRDISERKRAEALSSALYRIAEKASATQDLQQFFAAIHGIVDALMCPRNYC